MRDIEEFVMFSLGFIVLMFGLLILYFIISTYNDRNECTELGIPLHRCNARTYKMDIKVDE